MIAVIGGTGLADLPGVTAGTEQDVATPFGPAVVRSGRLEGRPVLFVARHGPGHCVPPHRVNYRANVWALREAGASAVVATAASGGISADLSPGDLVLLDQFIDATTGRADTFFDGDDGAVVHTDMTEPYHPAVRAAIGEAALAAGVAMRPRGTYVCTNGPRFETPAEIRAFAAVGAELVGMTGYPEVALAAEAGLPYASIGLVTNPAAGLGGGGITVADIMATVEDAAARVVSVIVEVVRRWPATS